MGIATKIFLYLIPLVFLIVVLALLFGGPASLFEKVKGAILGAKDYLPSFSVGLQEQKAEVSIPDEHKAEIANLKKTISSMLGQGKENCFAHYTKFSDLGEKGTSLQFKVENGKTFLTVSGGSGGKQVITDLSGEVPGMKPCVIAGAGGVSKNFFTHFIQGNKEQIYPYYQPVNSLTIFYTTSGINGNRISIPDLDLESHFDDNGWLFTPDGEQVCFFPTISTLFYRYSDSGIASDWLNEKGRSQSIPNRIAAGEPKQC